MQIRIRAPELKTDSSSIYFLHKRRFVSPGSGPEDRINFRMLNTREGRVGGRYCTWSWESGRRQRPQLCRAERTSYPAGFCTQDKKVQDTFPSLKWASSDRARDGIFASGSKSEPVLRSVADPDPGSGALWTPGSGIRNRFFPDPTITYESLRTICLGFKILQFCADLLKYFSVPVKKRCPYASRSYSRRSYSRRSYSRRSYWRRSYLEGRT